MSRCLRVVVHGRVQGVGFRYYTQREAQRLGVRGWVRNLPDATVEALISGEPDQLSAMLAWLRHGPVTANVDRIESIDAEEAETGSSFVIC